MRSLVLEFRKSMFFRPYVYPRVFFLSIIFKYVEKSPALGPQTAGQHIIDLPHGHARLNDWINDWTMIDSGLHKKSMIGFSAATQRTTTNRPG